MNIPYIQVDEVFHVGALEVSQKARQAKGSLEAFCLSVSLHPHDWTSIAKLGGNPVWQLSRPGSLWLDVLTLKAAARANIIAWAVDQGFAEPATYWRSWSTDDDGEWSYIRCASLEAAEYELDDPDEEGPCADGSRMDVEHGHRLTELGMTELERWQDASECLDGVVILYARDVISAEEPRLAGLWWGEAYDPAILSCPRGAILPSRLSQFETVNLDEPHSDDFDI